MLYTKVRRAGVVIVIFFLCSNLIACTLPFHKPFPKEGVWYCEELMISIDFGNETSEDQFAATKYNQDGTIRNIDCVIYNLDEICLSYTDRQLYEEYLAGYEEARLNGKESEYIRAYEEAADAAGEDYLWGKYYYQDGVFYAVNSSDKITYIFKQIDE